MRWIMQAMPLEDGRPLVTVMIPTRGRPDKLQRAIRSLYDYAYNRERIEVLLRVDDDDEATLKMLTTTPLNATALVGPRGRGYLDLHRHIHDMASRARGRWLMAFNDDAAIVGSEWDKQLDMVIATDDGSDFHRDGDTGALWLDNLWLLIPTMRARPTSNEFFIVHREVFEVLGHLSLNMGMDLWLDNIFTTIDRLMVMPNIHIEHQNDEHDQTFLEGRVTIKGQLLHELTASLEVLQGRLADTATLLGHIIALRKAGTGRIACTRCPEGLRLADGTLLVIPWERVDARRRAAEQETSAESLLAPNVIHSC